MTILEKINGFLDESIRVNTDKYVASHGKKPRGQGFWMIAINGKSHEFPHCSYGEAVKKAKAIAAKEKAFEIIPMP